jgi:flagellar secretion chaperone FliS
VPSAGGKEAPSTADKLLWVNIMWNNGHDAYLESRVLSADPIELVNMLYQGCMQAVREARLHLAEGRIAERSREITKACQIVIELAVSLDHERGGEISRRLALLYDYMHRRLLEANMRQSDEPLADVLGLLTTLSEGWEGIRTPESTPVAESALPAQPSTESAWSQPVTESAWSQPVTENAWSQLGVNSPSSSEPVTDNPWAPPVPESPWAQPVPQEGDYRLRAFSF